MATLQKWISTLVCVAYLLNLLPVPNLSAQETTADPAIRIFLPTIAKSEDRPGGGGGEVPTPIDRGDLQVCALYPIGLDAQTFSPIWPKEPP